MRTIILAALVVFCFPCSAGDIPTPAGSVAASSDNVRNIHAIVAFLERHRNDLPGGKISENDAVLGSQEDGFDFRVRTGLAGVEHENLRKYYSGKGWHYFATVKSFPTGEVSRAKEAANNFADALRAQLLKDGFEQVTDNPWPTIVFHKQIEAHLEIRVWVSYSEKSDGTFVTLMASPNYH